MGCMDGEWYPLPSGRVVCLNAELKYHDDAKAACNAVGGYLAEITNRDDMQVTGGGESQLSPGISLMSGVVHDTGILQS